MIQIRLIIAPHPSPTLKRHLPRIAQLQPTLMPRALTRIPIRHARQQTEIIPQHTIRINTIFNQQIIRHIRRFARFKHRASQRAIDTASCGQKAGFGTPAVEVQEVDVVAAVVVHGECVRGAGGAGEERELLAYGVDDGVGRVGERPLECAVPARFVDGEDVGGGHALEGAEDVAFGVRGCGGGVAGAVQGVVGGVGEGEDEGG